MPAEHEEPTQYLRADDTSVFPLISKLLGAVGGLLRPSSANPCTCPARWCDRQPARVWPDGSFAVTGSGDAPRTVSEGKGRTGEMCSASGPGRGRRLPAGAYQEVEVRHDAGWHGGGSARGRAGPIARPGHEVAGSVPGTRPPHR